MTLSRRLVLLMVLLFFGCLFAWAGDCSGPGDCSAIPDNATKGAVIISVFAGAGLAVRTMSGDDDDEAGDDGADDDGGDKPKDDNPDQPKPPEKKTTEGEGDSADLSALF